MGGSKGKGKSGSSGDLTGNLCELLRVGTGVGTGNGTGDDGDLGGTRVDLAALDPDSTPGFEGGKKAGMRALAALSDEITELQAKLMAHGYTGGHRRILVILQGMDTAGKGGAVKHAVGLLDPGGLRLKSFRKPTDEELSHDFLWRIRKELPAAGPGGLFDPAHHH